MSEMDIHIQVLTDYSLLLITIAMQFIMNISDIDLNLPMLRGSCPAVIFHIVREWDFHLSKENKKQDTFAI